MAQSIKLVTHNGSFHTDDVFAAACLTLYLEKKGESFEIIRTRDEEIIKDADYVFDVGGVYDESKNRFDHHQVGGAGSRIFDGSGGKTAIEYSSFGLVWKKFGEELCGDKKVASIVEKKLVMPVDSADNGFDLITNNYEISPYFIQQAFFSMVPTWREENTTKDEMFLKSVGIAKEILSREIIHAKDAVVAEKLVIDIYQNTQDKRIIVLDKNYPFEHILCNFPEPLFVIYPRANDDTWGIKAVRNDPKTFDNRKDLPEAWGGLRAEELQKVTGVGDAIFCHRALFMAVAKSKEGAIKLAELALKK